MFVSFNSKYLNDDGDNHNDEYDDDIRFNNSLFVYCFSELIIVVLHIIFIMVMFNLIKNLAIICNKANCIVYNNFIQFKSCRYIAAI